MMETANETSISLDEPSLGNSPTNAASVASHTSRWNVFGIQLPNEEIVFFVILIYLIAITGIVNLTMGAPNETLWTTLPNASLGYMLPAPQLNGHKKI